MNVFLVGETRFVEDPVFGREALMAHLGVPDWRSDAFTDAEELCEVMGRLCYMSFDPSLKRRNQDTPGSRGEDGSSPHQQPAHVVRDLDRNPHVRKSEPRRA